MLEISKKSLSLIVVILLLGINTYVFADFEYKINLSGANEITKGKIVNIAFSIYDIKMSPGEEIELKCTLNYDKTVFEKIENQNIEEKNGWNVSYEESKNELSVRFSEEELKSGAICVFNFKVREDADFDKTKIILKNLTSVIKNEEQEKQLENVELELNYKENSSIVNIPKEDKNNIKINNQTKNTTSTYSSNNTVKQEKENSETIQLYIAIALLVAVIIAIIVVFAIIHKN